MLPLKFHCKYFVLVHIKSDVSSVLLTSFVLLLECLYFGYSHFCDQIKQLYILFDVIPLGKYRYSGFRKPASFEAVELLGIKLFFFSFQLPNIILFQLPPVLANTGIWCKCAIFLILAQLQCFRSLFVPD